MSERNSTQEPEPERWVDLYGNALYRYALSRTPDPETARDLVQETLVAAVAAYQHFRGASSIKTWLVAILKRKIVDFYRKSNSREVAVDVQPTAQDTDQMFDETGHWHAMPQPWRVNPESAFAQKEFMDVLYRCLGKLPPRLAEIFSLREFEELDTESICRQMSITEANSWVMLYRARMQLRNCIEAGWLKDS